MTQTNQNVSTLIRAMRKDLLENHKVDVPYSALRASYLRANGQNEHAVRNRKISVTHVVVEHQPLNSGNDVWLHLVEDEIGCLELLALDEFGMFKIPEDFRFSSSIIRSLWAVIPRVKKYGLPDFIAKAGPFFRERFSLNLSPEFEPEFQELGGDEGDSGKIFVRLTDKDLKQLLEEFIQSGVTDPVAEWVGMNYQRNWDAEPDIKKWEWLMRYADANSTL